MQHAESFATAAEPWDAPDSSLEACDDGESGGGACYCPVALLGTFSLLMAGHGRCVSADMMLGDREYAMWQLARARAMGDDELRSVSSRLFGYFALTGARHAETAR